MKIKRFTTLVFCCCLFFTSFGQDSTQINLESVFKVHFSGGGSFLKNIKTQYLESNVPFTFIEGGIELGEKFNFEINLRRTSGSADTLNLNFTKIQFGFNNKSRLNENLVLVLRVGGGIIFESEDFMLKNSFEEKKARFLRIGGGLEQRLYNNSAFMFNIGYDMAKDSLFSGLGVSVGIKMAIPYSEKVNYF